jgi:UDP-glucuronate 4-epimerase
MRVFVTGTAGFIGYHVASYLLDKGNFVLGYDGMTQYYDVSLKVARHQILARSNGFKAVEAMLEDKDTLRRALDDFKPEVIIHLAAQAGVRYSIENPQAYIDSNLIGTFNIMEAARVHSVKHLLIASTSSVYGANKKVPFAEADQTDEPLTLYAATKKATEVMTHSYSHLWKIPTTAFRFFTVYGPYGRPDMALFKFVDAIYKDQEIGIYGEGQMRRDFTYVEDLAKSIMMLIDKAPAEANRVSQPGVIETLSEQAPFRIVNIGGGQPVGLLDFVETIEQTLGRKAKRKMLPMQKGDVPQTYAAPDLLEALTGYKPDTSVADGVAKFVKWYRDFYNIN